MATTTAWEENSESRLTVGPATMTYSCSNALVVKGAGFPTTQVMLA